MTELVHAGHIRLALARYLDWRHHVLMPEWEIGACRADLVSVSRAGYLTEYETKVSLADFLADFRKPKWQTLLTPVTSVSRFFFVVPESLVPEVRPHLPTGAGLLGVRRSKDWRGTRYAVREHVPAMRHPARKVAQGTIERMYRSAYFRYWNEQISRLGRVLEGAPS